MPLRRLVASDLSHRCNPLQTTGFRLLALYVRSKEELAGSVGGSELKKRFLFLLQSRIYDARATTRVESAIRAALVFRPIIDTPASAAPRVLLGGRPFRLSGWQVRSCMISNEEAARGKVCSHRFGCIKRGYSVAWRRWGSSRSCDAP